MAARFPQRILTLLRARLAAQRGDAAVPVAALLFQAFVASTLCGLVRGELPAFAYSLLALSISAALVALPLLGELAPLLVADETGDWVRAQPVRPFELHLARVAHVGIALCVLALGALVPAALIAGPELGIGARVLLVVLGLAQAFAIAGLLLGLQSVLRGRAQALLVLAQTLLFVGALVGGAVGLRLVPSMVDWTSPELVPAAALFPPAWFAAPLSEAPLSLGWKLLAPAVAVGAMAALIALPAPRLDVARKGTPLLGRLLTPLRELAARIWVRRDERAVFEWLFDALPVEREFVIRSYPLLAVPVAFLWIGASGEDARAVEGWLALLLFVPGAYLPLLAAHVPASRSFRARWILDTAPVPPAAVEAGAIKAIAVRFLVPFYLLLAALGCALGGTGLVLRLTLPGWIASVIVLRATWRRCVTAPPLSTPPDELYISQDWLGVLGLVAAALVGLAIAATKWADRGWTAALLAIALLLLERVLERKHRAPKDA